MVEIISIVVLVAVSVFMAVVEKRLFNPASIFAGIYAILIFFTAINLYDVMEYSDRSVLYILLGCVSFAAGAIASKALTKRKIVNRNGTHEKINEAIVYGLLAFVLIAYGFLAVQVIARLVGGAQYSDIRNMYLGYGNTETLIGNETLFSLFNFICSGVFSVVGPVVLIMFFNKQYNKKIFVMYLLCIALVVFSTGSRGTIVALITNVMALCIIYEFDVRTIFRFIKKAFVPLVVLLVIVAQLFSARQLKLDGSVNDFYGYLAIPVPLFSYWIDEADLAGTRLYGASVGYGFLSFVNNGSKLILGKNTTSFNDISEIMGAPQETWVKVFNGGRNIYNAVTTLFYNFYLDFGLLGIIAYSALYGAVMRWLYYRATSTRSFENVLWYVFLFSGLIGSFTKFQSINITFVVSVITIVLVLTLNKKRLVK